MRKYYGLDEAYKDVAFFNKAFKGIDSAYNPESEDFFKRVEFQHKLLQEEVHEVKEALLVKDKTNLLKEVCDVAVVLFGMIDILDKAGYDVQRAMEIVNDNNQSKILDNLQDAVESVEHHAEKGVNAYVDAVEIEGYQFYSVRRVDGKLLKPYNYVQGDVSECCPNSH